MYHEITIYQYTCDACGDCEESEVDGFPEGWTEEGDQHFCGRCS